MSTIVIGNNTIGVLKNFSNINQSISVKSGNVLETVSPQKNILARAVVEELFPSDFCLYDLPRFLGTIALFDNPDFQFQKKRVVIFAKKSKVEYTFTDPSMIVTVPEDPIIMPNVDIHFMLPDNEFKSVIRAASVLGFPNLVVRGNGEDILFVATDVSDPTSDTFSLKLGDTTETFEMVFKTENLKIMDGDYDVSISSKGISKFSSKTCDLVYWIALESNSSFGKIND